MFCNKCKAEIEDNSKFCSVCGAPVETTPSEELETIITESTASQAPKKLSWKALVGMIVSLSGLLFAGVICGIVGIIFSCLGLSDVSKNNKNGKGMATAGFVVGIVDIVFGVIGAIVSCATLYALFPGI